MRAILACTVLLLVFAAQIEQGESIIPFCKGLIADCQRYIPKIKEYLYSSICSKKCKQPMTVKLIEKKLEASFRKIAAYVIPQLKPTCGITLPKTITVDKMVSLAREFEHCPKVNSKKNLCDWCPKKDKAVLSELVQKAVSKGLSLAAPLLPHASKCDKCTPLAHKIMAGWDGKEGGDAPCVKKMLDEAFEEFCK